MPSCASTVDGRTASGRPTVIDDEGIAALVERTLAAVAVAPARRRDGRGSPRPAAPATSAAVDPATRDATPERPGRAWCAAFVDAAGGLETAGYCRTNHWRGGFANSAGQALAGRARRRRHGRHRPPRRLRRRRRGRRPARLADIDGAVLGARAAAKASAGGRPVELPPDRYEVVLEPSAVADLLEALSLLRLQRQGGRRAALVRARRRRPVRPGAHARRRRRRRPAWRSTPTARRRAACRSSTPGTHGRPDPRPPDGRRRPAPSSTGTRRRCGRRSGPSPATSCLAGAGGGDVATEVDGPVVDSATAELVAGVERGVLVTDFWYTRALDPADAVVTGLTRNGVWLIEDGEVTRPLRNFRFTQSYAQALMPGTVLGVGAVATALPGRHLLGDDAVVDGAGAAPGLVELHRRRQRLTDPVGAHRHVRDLCCDTEPGLSAPAASGGWPGPW